MNNSCKSGSKHLWNVIKYSRYLSDDLKKVVDPVISRNSFMAHPENLLLSMLADERRHIRQLTVRLIIKARGSSSTVERRRFVVPKPNFKVNQYIDMIDWFKCNVTEPPITVDLTVEELKSIAENGSVKDLQIYKFPCHTQSVERCIKLVAETASMVCESHNRDVLLEIPWRHGQLCFHLSTRLLTR
ncbi:hypothetical protein AVEN_102707-1 [Araneus ventricosus]|uniref:Uncharacterized protein n=1 Tax=Araneus ventricosus TaxID=182803 RepID=A0A4Y2MJL9_ARAVE|nr:hypothetical protein AVEN_102707-1 [Araneus ventricosus]